MPQQNDFSGSYHSLNVNKALRAVKHNHHTIFETQDLLNLLQNQ